LQISPSAAIRTASELQKKGNADGAIALLQNTREKFPDLGCDITVSLAVVLYTSGKKEAAQTELEKIVAGVDPASRAECMRSQFLLGSIHQDAGRTADSNKLFNMFLANSKDRADPQIKQIRTQLGAR
jgi:thioredoxin-like negative regulator of GroEL